MKNLIEEIKQQAFYIQPEDNDIIYVRASKVGQLISEKLGQIDGVVMPKIADVNKLIDLREKLVWGDILECYDKEELLKYATNKIKAKDIGLNEKGQKILNELEHIKYISNFSA